ncbi:MAG: cytochrome c biogenesis protein CcsA [Gemmatimonadota bacterium]
MVLPLHLTAVGAYLAAWVVQLRGFRVRRAGRQGVELYVMAAAAAVHLTALIVFSFDTRTIPLVGLGPASSSLALIIVVVFLLTSSGAEARPAGLFVLPCVLLLLVEAIAVGLQPVARQTAFREPWFAFHVTSIFIGYAGLLLASAAALMYLMQFRALKRKQFGSVFRFFPSLDALEGLNRVGLLIGFPALSLGLLAGWSFTLTYGRGLALGDPEVVLGIVSWLAYLTAIASRRRRRWRGRRAAFVSAGAFAVTVTAYVVLRLTLTASGFFL